MTTNPTTASTGERFEAVVQILIMLVIGATAGAASFTHVHDVAAAHGQPDWIGWADAVVVELMSIALGLELRRRARTGRPTGFVMTSLVLFITVSLAAQVVEAEPSLIGWLAAALPALGFLVLAKVVLSRTAAQATPTTRSVTRAATPATVSRAHAATAHTGRSRVIHDDDMPAAAPALEPEPEHEALPTELVTGARLVADAHHRATGTPITSDSLAERLRVSPATAHRLLAALGELQPATTLPAAVSQRVNGATPALVPDGSGALW